MSRPFRDFEMLCSFQPGILQLLKPSPLNPEPRNHKLPNPNPVNPPNRHTSALSCGVPGVESTVVWGGGGYGFRLRGLLWFGGGGGVRVQTAGFRVYTLNP